MAMYIYIVLVFKIITTDKAKIASVQFFSPVVWAAFFVWICTYI